MKIKIIGVFCLIIMTAGRSANAKISLLSPNGQLEIDFAAADLSPGIDAPAYQVFFRNKVFLRPSLMGFTLAGQPVLTTAFQLITSKMTKHNTLWKPLYGEKREYPDSYNQLQIQLKEKIMPYRILEITFRAYDEGVAFCYNFPVQPAMQKVTIVTEQTEFALSPGTMVWEEYGHEGTYEKITASSIKPGCELPLTVHTADGIFGTIAEGGNENYPRAYTQATALHRVNTSTLTLSLRGEARSSLPFRTAWRIITLSDHAGGLIEQNYLILNLNHPNKLKGDLSWIKPGKAIRDPEESTISCKKYIDYAAAHGLSYVIIDWGWYGVPFSESADPSRINVVNVSTGKPIPGHTGLDIPEVVAYGKANGVGIWLYVNRQGLERYADKAFPIYKQWGISGIKPGFINVGNQEWEQWIESIVKKAAKYHLMVDVHDAYRPTGATRTYPNWMSQEGVRGNEHSPGADHDATLPFTRYVIGAADYTPGYCRTTLQNTWAHKLALPIIFYSPVQFLFWGEKLSDCHERPELALWKNVPTTWDDTKVLSGDIGEFIVMARKKNKNWFVAGITNHDSRTVSLDFNFLDASKTYTATVYTDDVQGQEVLMATRLLKSDQSLTIPLLPSGGFAMEILEM